MALKICGKGQANPSIFKSHSFNGEDFKTDFAVEFNGAIFKSSQMVGRCPAAPLLSGGRKRKTDMAVGIPFS